MAGFLAAEMRRTTRDLLLASGVLFLALTGAALASARYLREFVDGPAAIRMKEIERVTDAEIDDYRYVTLTGEHCFDTGYTTNSLRRTKHGTTTIVHRYSLLVQGERALIVESTHGLVSRPVCSGKVRRLPESTRRGVEAALARAKSAGPWDLLAVELDADENRVAVFPALCIGIPLMLIAIWNLIRGGRRWRDPTRHPIVREVGRYGDFVETATAIELELAEGVTKIGPFRITKSWLLRSVFGQLDVVRIDDVLWAFLRRGRHPVLEIRSRIRPRLLAQTSTSRSMAVLGELFSRVPWAALDDDREWRKLWKQGVEAFAATIEERRRKIAAQGAIEPAAVARAPVAGGAIALTAGIKLTLLGK